MFLGPLGFSFRKDKAVSHTECIDLLFCLLQCLLVIISHADIFFDILILLIRNIYRLICSCSQGTGYLLRITLISFDLTCFLLRKRCRGNDNAFNAFFLKIFIKRVSKAACFISGNDGSIIAMILFNPFNILQDTLLFFLIIHQYYVLLEL